MENIKTSPKDFFLYLLSSIALYYCAGWLMSLLYDYVNFAFGSVDYYSYDTTWIPSSMRWAMASLIIVFPVYLWVTKRLNSDIAAYPEKRGLWVRKWLMYLTLALASIALVIDLVALVNQLLSGEFVLTFTLKVVAVALVAGMVFAYYFYELRRDAGLAAPARSLFRYGSLVFVLAAIIGAFFVVGSPEEARSRRFDGHRVSDLQNIQWQVINYWQKKGVLPENLLALNDSISGYRAPVDPETQMSYEYLPRQAELRFELCATFKNSVRSSMQTPGIYKADPYQESWQHDAGRHCFMRSIDPEMYPLITK